MPEPSEESVINALRETHALYTQLRSLAVEQRQLIAQADAEPLFTLLGRRQQIVDALGRLSGGVAATPLAELTGPTRQEAQRLLGEVRTMLEEELVGA